MAGKPNGKRGLQDDYRRVLSLAQLPEISVKNVAKVLFGQRIINFTETVSGYIGTARYYAAKFDSGEPKKESPPRFKGQDIHFSSRTRWPDFWVKQIGLSGDLPNRLRIAGAKESGRRGKEETKGNIQIINTGVFPLWEAH